ncbi:MAG: hypothetical protein KGQ36_00425 [Rickettsiales bacterium]|nr:hypothetical protein [Rickettsiales bacterium]
MSRTLSQSSPVPSIKNLVLWLDATQEDALTNTNGAKSVDNGDYIQSWTDKNPQFSIPLTFSIATTSRYPSYSESAINGLPALYFDGATDGTGDYLSTAEEARIAKPNSFTIFAVFKPIAGYSTSEGCLGILTKQTGSVISNPPYAVCFVGVRSKFGGSVVNDGDTSGATSNLNATGSNDNSIVNGNSYIGTLSHAINVTSTGFKSFLNGGNYFKTSATYSTGLSGGNLVIGAQKTSVDTRFFKGYIAEIVMYNRNLTNEEANSVLSYLGQKWKISVDKMTQL